MDERDSDFMDDDDIEMEGTVEEIDNAVGISDEITYIVMVPAANGVRHGVWYKPDCQAALEWADKLLEMGVAKETINIYQAKKVLR